MVLRPPPSHPWFVDVGVAVQVGHTVAAVVELLGLDLSGNRDRVRVVGANYFPQRDAISRSGALRLPLAVSVNKSTQCVSTSFSRRMCVYSIL